MVSPVATLWRRLPWRTRIVGALLVWCAAEALVLDLVVHAVGVSGALLLGLATSLVGASLAKRLGRAALSGLRRRAGPGGLDLPQGETALDGVLAGTGAVLLLLPGFLTDALGLILAMPAARRVLGRWLQGGGLRAVRGQPRAQHGPREIDLDHGDWRAEDDRRMPKA